MKHELNSVIKNATFVILFGAFPPLVATALELTPEEILGRSIFFDTNLSIAKNQSCADCHMPATGWTGPNSAINSAGAVYEGSIRGRFGNRKPPSAAYATLSPIFHIDKKGLFIGGNFWDGRATGEKLGNPAADQAQGPFLNPAEQALPDSACVVYRVCNPAEPEEYPVSFTAIWGEEACNIAWPEDEDVELQCEDELGQLELSVEDRNTADETYDYIALSIATYEDSPEANSFSSKFDFDSKSVAKLNKQERLGFSLFRGKGKCSKCHSSNGQRPLFTDNTYDNLGIPKNPENPIYSENPNFIDAGLGGFLKSLGYPEDIYLNEWGKQRVPTLRNVGLKPAPSFVKAYGHNGYFKTLKGIVHFYNTRDLKDTCPGSYTEVEALSADCWPEPEVAINVNSEELGNLGLTDAEEDAIVSFLEILSDGFEP